jgi:hypothetical protein
MSGLEKQRTLVLRRPWARSGLRLGWSAGPLSPTADVRAVSRLRTLAATSRQTSRKRLCCSVQRVFDSNNPPRKVLIFIFPGAPPLSWIRRFRFTASTGSRGPQIFSFVRHAGRDAVPSRAIGEGSSTCSLPEILISGENQPLYDGKDHCGRNAEHERSIRRLQRSQQPPRWGEKQISVAQRRVVDRGFVEGG